MRDNLNLLELLLLSSNKSLHKIKVTKRIKMIAKLNKGINMQGYSNVYIKRILPKKIIKV